MNWTDKFDLTLLREIGWRTWNPIGLDGHPDDEYDHYLLRAAESLWKGADEYKITQYFLSNETNSMGVMLPML